MYFHMLASPCARIVGRSFDKNVRSPCSQVMPKRKPERAVLEEAYDIEKLLWYRGPAGAREYLACWKGFSAVGDTWEPERHIHPTKLITAWNTIPLTVRQAVWLLREAIARQLTSRQIAERTARFEFIFTVEELRIAGVGHAVLQHLAAIAGVQVTVDGGAMGFALDVDSLNAIDRVVLLHANRPTAGVGGLRVCCGAASYKDMMMVTGIVLRSFQAETDDGTFGAYKFEVTLTTTIFNGKSGAPRWPAAPYPTAQNPGQEDLRYSQDEQATVVAHAKRLLQQPWAPEPVHHHLRRNLWHALPADRWWLPQALANPGPPTRRPAAVIAAAQKEKEARREAKAAAAKGAWRGRAERAKGRK